MCTEFCDGKENKKNRMEDKIDLFKKPFGQLEKIHFEPKVKAGLDYKPQRDLETLQSALMKQYSADQFLKQTVGSFQATPLGFKISF